jgi:mannosyltransferase
MPLWMRALPPAVTLAIMLWGIQGASYSRDEAATMSAVRRPFAQLLRMLQYVDVFHGAYYVLIWPIASLVSAGELATRLPSALAMTVAASATAGIGRRLISPRAGLAAGLVFAVLPEVSLYCQTARPYAMATALAAVASYILVRAIQAAVAGGQAGRWLLTYGACITALAYIHPFALLLLVAHAVPVAWRWLRNRNDRDLGLLALGWFVAGLLSSLLALPLVEASERQSQHISLEWAKASAGNEFSGLTSPIGPFWMAVAAGFVVLGAIAAGLLAGRPRLRADWPADLLTLTIPWLIVPAAILIAASEITPVYSFRYVVFCMPAAALLVGAGLAAMDWRAGAAAFVAIALLGYSTQVSMRSPAGHGDSIRAADQIIAAHARPGDVELYTRFAEPIGAAYPYGIGALPNVEVGESAAQSGTLGGTWASWYRTLRRLERARRVWYIQLLPTQGAGQEPKDLVRFGFVPVRGWHTTKMSVILYARR